MTRRLAFSASSHSKCPTILGQNTYTLEGGTPGGYPAKPAEQNTKTVSKALISVDATRPSVLGNIFSGGTFVDDNNDNGRMIPLSG